MRGSQPFPTCAARSTSASAANDYPHWRGAFYPAGLPRSRWLAYASRAFNSIELNGTFYAYVNSASSEAQAARSRAGRTSRASRRTPRVSSA